MTEKRPDFSPDSLPEPELIVDDRALGEMLAFLADQPVVAVDTEADSFFSYREKVCLVQVTAGGRDYLVDPLARLDFTPFGEVLADPQRIKIFHDGEYDVLILKRDYGFDFAALFDTRVAAAVIGHEAPGLASVLKAHFGVVLNKAMQRSDWSQRPLSPKQISYARLDTHFLLELMAEQKAELEDLGRAHIVAGECRRLEALVPPEVVFDPNGFARIRGVRELAPISRQALKELYLFRDGIAERRNRPPFKVLQNSAMLELAAALPKSVKAMHGIRGLSERVLRDLGNGLLEALERARAAGPLERLPRPAKRRRDDELDEIAQEFHERLKDWRKRWGEKLGVESAYLLNRHGLLELARNRPATMEQLSALAGLQPWQVEEKGGELLELTRRFEGDLAAGKIKSRRRRRR
ncbi:MAG TPA: HRDC domain-containing protein [Planctomycetota bacterium]|jgi:ribonuclease D|nr:HRDC domain-containing protein [Planctomycetota bacterium]